MATAPDIVEEVEDDAPVTLTIPVILQTERLIEALPDDQLNRIGSRCLDGFRADLQSRSQGDEGDCWEDRYKRYLDIAMQVREPRTMPWPNASNIKFPLLTTAAVQFQARAYPAIVDGSNLVKGRVLGQDPDGQKRARADRIGDHMTWQLLYDMPGWEEATDRLLLQLPIVGSVFRKTYYDVVQKRNVSKTVTALDFVINYWAESIEAAPRYSEIMRFYPHEIEERFRSGIWRRVPVPVSNDAQDDSETAPVEFLEQFCLIDLDEDDYPEPYIVTLVRDSGAVVRIEPAYDEDTVTLNMATGEVVRVEAKQYFTQYGFFPAPDGSFYHIGFGALLDDITAAIDKSLNHLLDAGALQNAQGGFIGAGVNIRSGELKFKLGEWKRLDVTGGTLRENIVPLNLPGPSAVLFNLLEMLIGAAKEITSVQDILTGASQGATTPATTVLAQIEQATKVMTAIFKRIHRSFGQELRILFGLNRDFLDENAYYALTDQPGQIGRADYQDKDIDVIPVSDPTMVNDAQRALKAQSLLAFNGDPLVNQEEIRRRYFEGTGQPNVDALMTVPAPPPNPEIIAKAAEMENTRDKTKSEIRKNNATAANDILNAAETAQRMNLLDDTATLVGAAVRLATDAADMEDNGEPIAQPGSAGGVEEPQPDAGLPPISEGPAVGADGGMVAGSGGEPAGSGVPGGNPAPVL
ncbi:portal protein [Sphingobium chungbukense]|uniref:portal protein n=1 Tax=Sphingobium chungbukense TaxID=56193 RepID=UPI00069A6F7F|nr:hypothetical protein [Sphingobium chungbukense]